MALIASNKNKCSQAMNGYMKVCEEFECFFTES